VSKARVNTLHAGLWGYRHATLHLADQSPRQAKHGSLTFAWQCAKNTICFSARGFEFALPIKPGPSKPFVTSTCCQTWKDSLKIQDLPRMEASLLLAVQQITKGIKPYTLPHDTAHVGRTERLEAVVRSAVRHLDDEA
jgi:hypothetical protein